MWQVIMDDRVTSSKLIGDFNYVVVPHRIREKYWTQSVVQCPCITSQIIAQCTHLNKLQIFVISQQRNEIPSWTNAFLSYFALWYKFYITNPLFYIPLFDITIQFVIPLTTLTMINDDISISYAEIFTKWNMKIE